MRKETRQSVHRWARIELGDNRSLGCRICNMSNGGALLRVQNVKSLPKTFALTDIIAGTTRRVAIVWIGRDRVGVRFLEEPPKPKPKAFGRRANLLSQ